MNIDSGFFLAEGDLAAYNWKDSIGLSVLSYKNGEPNNLTCWYENIRFLAASHYGEYFAFWSDKNYCFNIFELSGEWIWSGDLNADKAIPTGLKCSSSSNAVACFFHFEFIPGMFFCDMDKGISTIFPCGRPIGHDEDLQYFALSNYEPYEYNKWPFFEADPLSGNVVRLPLEITEKRLENGPVIVNRNRCILAQPAALKENWDGLAIQKDMTGFVILRDRNLSWFSINSDKPEITIKNCLPEADHYKDYEMTLSLSEDNVLIQIKDKSIVVNRNHGVIWTGNNLSSTLPRGNRILAQYWDGSIVVIREDGSQEMKYLSTPGSIVRAADIIDNTLHIAEKGRSYSLKTFKLGD